MRAPLSWLRELVELPAGESGRAVAERLVAAGLEVETVEQLGVDLTGPVVVGEVVEFDEEPQKNGKTIRWCQVRVGDDDVRGIVCGASNFAAGDLVVVALAGAVLPGGFAISARKTYGHTSDGMICAAVELGMGEDGGSGIIVLPADVAAVGSDAIELLGLRDEVLDIAVTPDRGYCFSLRGIAREAATAYGVDFRDPAQVPLPEPSGAAHEGHVADPTGADRLVLRTVTGFDPAAASPIWLQRRLQMCGMRPISLAVDITNYVMLETGQPLHAFDRARLTGPITIRRAHEGESLETLDRVERALHHEDVVVADDSGPLALAGTMGGTTSEVSSTTTELVVEAAHFAPVAVARQARRHKLSTEASRRFERGVDHELPPYASARAVALLAELGGGVVTGASEVDLRPAPLSIHVPADRAGRTAGRPIDRDTVVARLESVGCLVRGGDELEVVPPSWRPDLTDPADLDEEVLRLEGYDSIPSVLPSAPAGRGLTHEQRLRRRVGLAVSGAGFVEVLNYPFVGDAELDALGLPADDPRRRTLRLANPLSDEQPYLRTTLLPGLLAALRRNVGRGSTDVALFETGLVVRPAGELPPIPRLPVDRRPTPEEIAAVEAGLPDQPSRLAAVLTGERAPAGWWGAARPSGWADAIELARRVAAVLDVELEVRADEHAPWHPGRCAALLLADEVVGHAGELHPRVVQALGLPARTAAVELALDPLLAASQVVVADGTLSTFPVATQDVALVVEQGVAAADVEAALRAGAGELLESLRLFDVYEGAQVGEGRRSLAYALRFRAPDRTLTVEEATAARDAAVTVAAERTGAVLRA